MPIYEFHCNACDRDSELLLRSAHWEGSKCPHCGSAKLAKKFSVFAASGSGESADGGSCSPAAMPRGGGCCGGHCHGGH
jgi:putative FmdB family regulatory protein